MSFSPYERTQTASSSSDIMCAYLPLYLSHASDMRKYSHDSASLTVNFSLVNVQPPANGLTDSMSPPPPGNDQPSLSPFCANRAGSSFVLPSFSVTTANGIGFFTSSRPVVLFLMDAISPFSPNLTATYSFSSPAPDAAHAQSHAAKTIRHALFIVRPPFYISSESRSTESRIALRFSGRVRFQVVMR